MDKVVLDMIFKVVGGLGIFLIGMRYMSDGLQAIAGASLRKIVHLATNNRFLGVLSGLGVTVLVQSSSVTTVMAVGFVNSGIMQLNQAINLILGANIGTTITGWVLAMKVGIYGLPILGVSAFFYLFSKSDKVKYFAYSIMGIGMVFYGLSLMKAGFKPIRHYPSFEAWFHTFDATTLGGIIACAVVGCILTVIVQSSSATLGITIGLASTGVLEFETAAALVLGENVGTTITAFLASIGASTNARRSAYFHILFNLIGVFWIISIFHFYMPFIENCLSYFHGIEDVHAYVVTGVDAVSGVEERDYKHVTTGIALVHTIFNVANVLLFLPFTVYFANLLERIVKDKSVKNANYLTHLDFQMFDSPFAALEQSGHEIGKMRDSTRTMMSTLKNYVSEKDDDAAKDIFEREDILDKVQAEITTFLTDVLSATLSHEQTEDAKMQIQLADELESISDYVMQALKLFIRLEEAEHNLSDHQKDMMLALHAQVTELFEMVNSVEHDTNIQELLIKSTQAGDDITRRARQLRNEHWEAIANEKVHPLVSTVYNDIIVSYRKIKAHLVVIAEVLAHQK